MKKNMAVLGSTGSIGTQTLEVAKNLGIKVGAIAGNKNISLLEHQAREFSPEIIAVFDEKNAKKLKENIRDLNSKVVCGMDGLCEISCFSKSDILVTAISGMIGLKPTIAAINAKKDIAIANKETLVAGGNLVMNLAKENKVNILPVDSEHSAIFQCLQGCHNKKDLKKLILTASGGPFFGKTKEELKNVTLEDALNHPNWNMGAKITIDSATMMNKGLEIIEAVHLFDVPEDKIDVIIHRESIIHSMVEYKDGAVLAQLGIPSMKIPIQYALTYPKRKTSETEALNLGKIKNLSFYPPDTNVFETINICRRAIKQGGNKPITVNAANEEAVGMFLANKIKFTDITEIIKECEKHFAYEKINTLEQILEADEKAREFARNMDIKS